LEEQELSVRDYFEVMKRRKKLILLVFVIAVAGSAVISFILPPVYQVKSTIKIGQIVDLSTFEKIPIESAVASVQFLQGSQVLGDAIQDLKLPFTLKKLRKRISAEPVRQEEDLVEIRIEMIHPHQALDIANYLVDRLRERHREIKQLHEDKSQILARYDEHIASIAKQLSDVDGSKKEILTGYDEHTEGINKQLAMIDANEKKILTEYDERIKEINKQLAEIKEDVSKKKEEMEKLQKIAQATSLELESRMKGSKPLSDAESRLLVGIIADITNRIGGYRVDIEVKENRYDALMKESREDEIRKTEFFQSIQIQSDVLRDELRQVQVKKTELTRGAQEEFDTLMVQLRQIEIEKTKLQRLESAKMYTTEVVVLPKEPEEPIRPNKLLNIVVAAVISLVVGLGLVFSLESFARTK